MTLQAGEFRIVQFEISSEQLKFHNLNQDFVLEPGSFEVMVGPNSEELLTAEFMLKL